MTFVTGQVKMAAEGEEDEEIWDNWEDVADSGELERRMEERDKQVRGEDVKVEETNNSPKAPVLMKEETNRTQYAPKLRILKRPDSPASQNASAVTKEKPVHKTLAERQAQYAEARARILGSAVEESSDSGETPHLVTSEEKLPENVIRQPKGPDGSSGFQVQR